MTGAVRRWSESLASAGASVVIAFDAGDEVGDTPMSPCVEWVPVRHVGRGWRLLPVGLDEALRGADLLVLHSAWVLHNVWAAAIATQLDVPYLLEPRGAYNPHILHRKRFAKRVWWIAWERQLVNSARAVHVFFDEEKSHIAALGYRGGLVRAPNGIVTPASAVWDGGSGRYILWLGRFDPEHKGLDLLLRAMRLIPAEARPHLRLHGPEFRGGKRAMRRLVRSLGLEQSVTVGDPIYGRVKWEVLSRAAGFVYPSRWEGFGNSVAEAVSIGVPTLVTPYPLGRFLAERSGAILSEPTPEGLARGLQALLTRRAREIAIRGAEVIREEMSWDVVARSWLAQAEALL